MAHYVTRWHGPALVANDLSDLKGDYTSASVRRLWKRDTDSSYGSAALTEAIEGTGEDADEEDIVQFAITSILANTDHGSGVVSDYTAYLRSSNFRFNIPSEATIVGCKIRWKGQSTSNASPSALEIQDHHLYIVVGGSYILAEEAMEDPDGTGDDAGFRSNANAEWGEHAVEGQDLGWQTRLNSVALPLTTPDDGGLGGYTTDIMTPARINCPTFGFVLSAKNNDTSTASPSSPNWPSIEHTRMRIWYDISTPESSNLRSSILNNWNGSLDTEFTETLWEPDEADDGAIDASLNQGMNIDNETNLSHPKFFSIVDSDPIKTGASFAFSFWIDPYATGDTTVGQVLMSRYGGTDGVLSEYTILRKGKKIEVALYYSGATADTVISSGDILETAATGNWQHLVIDFNGTHMKLYCNGVFKETLSFPNGNKSGAVKFKLGKKSASAPFGRDAFSMLGFWKHSGAGFLLGQSNVDILFNSGLGLRYNSIPVSLKGALIAYWDLDEGGDIDSQDKHEKFSGLDLMNTGTTTTKDGPGTEEYHSNSYIQRNLATTSLLPTLHLGSRNVYVDGASREQAL